VKRRETRKNFNLFVDGVGKAGVVEEFVTPDIASKTEEFRAGGLNAPIEIELGMEKMEASMMLHEHTKENAASMGLLDGQNIGFTLRGVIDTGEAKKPNIITMRGRVKKKHSSTWKAGESPGHKFDIALEYFKETIDGQVEIEIDILNHKAIFNGVDKLEEERAILGIQS